MRTCTYCVFFVFTAALAAQQTPTIQENLAVAFEQQLGLPADSIRIVKVSKKGDSVRAVPVGGRDVLGEDLATNGHWSKANRFMTVLNHGSFTAYRFDADTASMHVIKHRKYYGIHFDKWRPTKRAPKCLVLHVAVEVLWKNISRGHTDQGEIARGLAAQGLFVPALAASGVLPKK